MATDRQIAFITTLSATAGHASNIDAINAYGLGLRTARDLTVNEASDLIDWLQGKPTKAEIEAPVAAKASKVRTTNKGGRVGAAVRTKSGSDGVVISDNGAKIRVQFKDGSTGSYEPAAVIFH